MRTTIQLETMKFHAFHGVKVEERAIGGVYLVDVSYSIDTDAVESDRLEDTINYSDVYEVVKEEMTKPSQLIEHVAGRILTTIESRFTQIRDLIIKVSKHNPPVDGEMVNVSVIIQSKK